METTNENENRFLSPASGEVEKHKKLLILGLPKK